MSVAVIVPWQDIGCEHRSAALDFTTCRLGQQFPDWELYIATLDDGPWAKGAAIANVLDSIDADHLVIVDADCLVPPEALRDATDALDSHAWAVPHKMVRRLTAEATSALLADEPFNPRKLARGAYVGVPTGGILAIRRDAYGDAGGFDPTFEGWGGEDVTFSRVLHRLYGPPWRGTADLIHLWHPPAGPTMSPANRAHARRWRLACRDVDALRAFIDERRQACPTPLG